MSVAFRREGDDEHMEPRFELPIPAGPNWVTARGLRLTREMVAALEAVELNGMVEEDAKKHRRVLRYWRTRLATAQLRPVAAGDAVAFGCRVTYRLNGQTRTVVIVGDDEADPSNGRISFSAPLARALMDSVVSDRLDFAGKPDAVEIIGIALSDEE